MTLAITVGHRVNGAFPWLARCQSEGAVMDNTTTLVEADRFSDAVARIHKRQTVVYAGQVWSLWRTPVNGYYNLSVEDGGLTRQVAQWRDSDPSQDDIAQAVSDYWVRKAQR